MFIHDHLVWMFISCLRLSYRRVASDYQLMVVVVRWFWIRSLLILHWPSFKNPNWLSLIFHVKWLWILFISGHEESYNPPPEYLPTKEEVREMRWIVSQLTMYAYIFFHWLMVFSQVMQTMVLKFVSVPSVAKGKKAKTWRKKDLFTGLGWSIWEKTLPLVLSTIFSLLLTLLPSK